MVLLRAQAVIRAMILRGEPAEQRVRLQDGVLVAPGHRTGR